MKCNLTLCLVLLASFSFHTLKGQDTLINFSNKWSTELNINPLNGSFSLNNANGQIKIRKFNLNQTAFRLALTVGYKQEVSKRKEPYGTVPVNDANRSSSGTVLINIGQEKHFPGSRRLSPYIGYEAGFGLKISTERMKTQSNERVVKGAWETFSTGYPQYRSYSERGFWSVGLNAVTGIDFYLVKNLYVGCEVAFGIDYLRYTNIEIDDPSDGANYPDLVEFAWKVGPKLLNGIRIGYIF